MTPKRKNKRENEQGKEVLRALVSSFFSSAMKLKTKEEIQEVYADRESQWMYYAHKQKNNPKTRSNIMMDSFESSIMKAHTPILNSDRSVETKLALLRVLRHVQGKGKLVCFLRELPLWVKHSFNHYKKAKEKKHEEMINPSLKLKVTK